MKKLIVLGQAQASALATMLSRVEAITERYDVVYAIPGEIPSHERDDIVLLEQYEDARNDHFKLASNRVLRFPRLRFGLLWPLWVENPFDRPEPPQFPHGRFPYGDNYVVNCVRIDTPPSDIVPFMRTSKWPASWPSLKALFAAETARLKQLDDACDIKMAFHIMKRFRSERLFHAPIAPTVALLRELAARVAAVVLGDRSVAARIRKVVFPEVLQGLQVPIHPYVAHHFGLEWYAAIAAYNHGSQTLTYDEYFNALVAHSYAVKHGARTESRHQKTMIIYGNCQAEAVASILGACALDNVRIVFLRSFVEPGQEAQEINRGDVFECDVLWEQRDELSPFPHRAWLSPACTTIKFPAVDFNLLWPLTGTNPLSRPDPPKFPFGRFPYGNVVITDAVRQGLSADDAVTFLRESAHKRLPDLDRLLAIETARLKARDAQCDIAMGSYIIEHFRETRLFWTVNHPTAHLLATLVRSLIERTTSIEQLASIDVEKALKKFGTGGPLGVTSTPILPEVAAHYGLRWYAANKELYQHFGSTYSFNEYFRALAEDARSNLPQNARD